MPRLTIAAAARLCGCPRSTLQRAIRAGRLHLDAAHCLDTDELSRVGYLATPGARQPHAPAAPQPRAAALQDHEALWRDMQRSLERVVDALDRLTAAVQQMQQERTSRTPPPAARTLQPRDMEPPPLAAVPPGPRGARSSLRQQVLALLEQHPEGLTAVQVRQALGVPTPLSDTINAMVRDGKLRRVARGLYAVA